MKLMGVHRDKEGMRYCRTKRGDVHDRCHSVSPPQGAMSHVTRWRNFSIDQIEEEIASFLVLGAAGPLPSLRGNLIVAGGHDNEAS